MFKQFLSLLINKSDFKKEENVLSGMKKLWDKYQAVPIGLLFTLVFVEILSSVDLIRLSEDDVLFNVLGFLFYSGAISLAVHQYFKRGGTLVKVIAGFIVFLIFAFTIGYFTNHVQDNPLTIFLLIGFWLLMFYLILPDFVKKYRLVIFGLYGIAAAYFIYVRLLTGGFETYESSYKNIALTLFLLPIPVVAGLWIYDQWKWFQLLKADKANAELALLKNQVNPHFFFNTLNNLYSLSVNKSDKTPEMILRLSEMMRHTIYEGKKDKVLLSEEIEYLRSFIELHQIRYNKEVDISFTAPEETTLEIAPLLFIVLLENAFKHGVESLRKSAFVHIDLVLEENVVSFRVVNNFDKKTHSEEKGIGLENLKRRLELLYPGKHQLVLEKEQEIFKVELKIEL